MAASASAVEARSTSAVCEPVAGLKTGAVRPDLPSVGRPSIQWEMRVVMLQNLRNSAAQHNISAAMLQNMTTTRKLISELEHRMAEPTAKGLASAVSRAVRDGVLAAGDRLPPIR